MRDSLFPCLDKCFPGIAAIYNRFERIGLHWDEASQPFTIERGGRIVAHAGLLTLPLLFNGAPHPVAALHAVCTDPAERRKGYATAVLNEALAAADLRFKTALLFTDKPAFYARWGFAPVVEHFFSLRRAASGAHTARPLRADRPEDVRLLKQTLQTRAPLSQRFCVDDRGDVLLFNTLSTYPLFMHLHHCPTLDTLVAWDSKGPLLKIYDVLAASLPSLDALLQYAPHLVEEIHFYFSPDRFTPNATPQLYTEGDRLLVRGEWTAIPGMIQPLSRC